MAVKVAKVAKIANVFGITPPAAGPARTPDPGTASGPARDTQAGIYTSDRAVTTRYTDPETALAHRDKFFSAA